MTTNQDHETGRPSDKERLSKGREFQVRITEGGCVTLDLTMDAELRVVRAFAIDEDRLREMLIVSSVVAGHVEGVCMRMARMPDGETMGQSDTEKGEPK